MDHIDVHAFTILLLKYDLEYGEKSQTYTKNVTFEQRPETSEGEKLAFL